MLVARCWSLVALSVCVCVCVRGCVGVYLRRCLCLCCPRICICIGLGTCRSHSCGLCIPSFPWISKRRSFLSRTLRLSVARLISRSVSLALLLALLRCSRCSRCSRRSPNHAHIRSAFTAHQPKTQPKEGLDDVKSWEIGKSKKL